VLAVSVPDCLLRAGWFPRFPDEPASDAEVLPLTATELSRRCTLCSRCGIKRPVVGTTGQLLAEPARRGSIDGPLKLVAHFDYW